MPKKRKERPEQPWYTSKPKVEPHWCGDRQLPDNPAYANTKIIATAPSVCTPPGGGYHWGAYN